VTLVPLGGRQAVELQPLEDAPHAGGADLDVVVALEVHGDPGWAEVVVLAQVEDLADHLGTGGVGTDQRPVRAVPEPIQAIGVIAAPPGIEALAADAEVAAGQRHVAGDLLSMAQDGESSLGHPGQLLLGHGVSSLVGDPKCQPSPSVPYHLAGTGVAWVVMGSALGDGEQWLGERCELVQLGAGQLLARQAGRPAAGGDRG
jgi:hypothetical protein